MKALSLALILLATVAWADPASLDQEGEVGGSGPTTEAFVRLPYDFKMFEPTNEYHFETTHGKICFKVKNDIKRCITTKWLYMMLVMAGIGEPENGRTNLTAGEHDR